MTRKAQGQEENGLPLANRETEREGFGEARCIKFLKPLKDFMTFWLSRPTVSVEKKLGGAEQAEPILKGIGILAALKTCFFFFLMRSTRRVDDHECSLQQK